MVSDAHAVHHDRHRACVLLGSWWSVTTDTVASRAAHAAYYGCPALASHPRPPQAAARHTARSDRGPMAPARAASAAHPTVLRVQAAGPPLPAPSVRYTGRPATCSPYRSRAAVLPVQRPGHDALACLHAVPVPRTPAPGALAPTPWRRAEMPGPCADSPGV